MEKEHAILEADTQVVENTGWVGGETGAYLNKKMHCLLVPEIFILRGIEQNMLVYLFRIACNGIRDEHKKYAV